MLIDIRLCFIGDSFVNGAGDPEKLGWVGRLCALSETSERQITVYNLGVRRESSDDILGRWFNECKIRFPEASNNGLVFSFGVNDSVIDNGQLRVKQGQSIINARTILLKARELYPVLMIGPPPIEDKDTNKRIKILDKQFDELCKGIEVPYLSLFHTLNDSFIWKQQISQNDGAHPSSEGYALLAEEVFKWHEWTNFLEFLSDDENAIA
ncbi:MAG: lipase [Gammaproteobacteria bacterium]|nr:lipase [Gammaproteobacteria bacterium]